MLGASHASDLGEGPQRNFKFVLKVLAKSSAFLRVNYAANQVVLQDVFAPGLGAKTYAFDKVCNEYVILVFLTAQADPLRVEQVEESLLRGESTVVLALTNNSQCKADH